MLICMRMRMPATLIKAIYVLDNPHRDLDKMMVKEAIVNLEWPSSNNISWSLIMEGMESFNNSDATIVADLEKIVKKKVNNVVGKVEWPTISKNNTGWSPLLDAIHSSNFSNATTIADLDKMLKGVIEKVEWPAKTSNNTRWSPPMEAMESSNYSDASIEADLDELVKFMVKDFVFV
ncbi:unnamed protein product [Ilex paraguariensis]|uniref:Uncharacterized protein n=1 Tax=Ilex paraguariensis TaxID=185542 RepID=A0ABC8QXC7_9AQUA